MDLLSSLMDILGVSSAQAATPPPTEAPLPPPRFSGGGALTGMPQAPQAAPINAPGISGGGALPVADSLKQLFDQPPHAPAQRTMVRQPMAPPMQQPQQAPDNQITGADVQRFIRSVATGAGRADPRAPGVSAFAQGAMGATQNSYGELEREKAQKLAERRADTQDRRADNALAMQGARDKRAEDEFNRKVTRDERVDAERQVRMQERLARIANLKDERLRPQDVGNFQRNMLSKARVLQLQVTQGAKTSEQAEKELEDFRRDAIEQYVTRNPGAKAPPQKPTPDFQPGNVYRFNGQQMRFKGGDPLDHNNYEKVN